MLEIVNKSMDRDDLVGDKPVIVEKINGVIVEMYSRGVFMTSWLGTLPGDPPEDKLSCELIVNAALRAPSRIKDFTVPIAMCDRGEDYAPLPSSVDDNRIPWYLYWEIFWVAAKGPGLGAGARILDAGGTSSLFSCFAASAGCEVHSIDLTDKLVENGRRIAAVMEWNMKSYNMDMRELKFEDCFFDAVYSICVFEHLSFELRQKALREMARVLKPGGVAAITFDYRNPAPSIQGIGPDTSPVNRIDNEADIKRNFLSTGLFEMAGNKEFLDNGKSYLSHPSFDGGKYSFGAIFLRKKGD